MERIVVEVNVRDYIDYKATHTRVEYIKAIRRMRADAQRESCKLNHKCCCKYV